MDVAEQIDSSADQFPSDWKVVRLGELLRRPPSYGINAAATAFDSGLPVYIRITDISDDGKFNRDFRVSVDSQFSGQYKLESGDVVFARTGASVGKAYLYDPNDGILVYAGFLIRISADTEKLSPEYLYQFARSDKYWTWVREQSMRSGQPGINGRQYAALPIPVPPTKHEQDAIARVLSDFDDYIESLEQRVSKKRAVAHASLHELLTGKQRLASYESELGMKDSAVGLIPEDWSAIRLQQLLTQPATYGVVKAGAFQDNGVRMLRGGDIKRGRVSMDLPFITEEKSAEYQRTVLRKGDVVIALVGYPGEAAVVPDALACANISRAVGLLRPRSEVNAHFLACYLNSPIGRQEFLKPSAGSAQLVVNLRDVDQLWIAVPSTQDEQEAIAAAITDMEAEIAVLELKRDKARYIKHGVAQNLLSGQIRLK